MDQIKMLEAQNKDLQSTVDDILSAAFAYSDKPHLLFSAIRRAAIKHLGDKDSKEIVANMDWLYSNIGTLTRTARQNTISSKRKK